MKLGGDEESPPPRHTRSIGSLESILENQQGSDIGSGEDAANNELGMLEADEGDDRLAQAGEEDSTEESAGHGAGEGEVIIRV